VRELAGGPGDRAKTVTGILGRFEVMRALFLPARSLLGWMLGFGLTWTTLAQGTQADYERATTFAERTENRVFRARVRPQWIVDGTRCWYELEVGPGRREWWVVEAETGRRTPLFDGAKLAQVLGAEVKQELKPDALALERLEVDPAGQVARFRAGGKRWRLTLADGSLQPDDQPETTLAPRPANARRARSRTTGEETSLTFVNRSREDVELYWIDTEGQRKGYGRIRPGQERPQHTFAGHVWMLTDRLGTALATFEATEAPGRAVLEDGQKPAAKEVTPAPAGEPGGERPRGTSPDGQWVAFVRDHNLQLRPRAGGEAVALSRDGTPEDAYSPDVTWAPDGSVVVARRVQKGQEHPVTMVEVAPRDQVQPKLHTHNYLKPGDRLPRPRLRVFRVADRRQFNVDEKAYENPFTESGDLDLRWAPDGKAFTFVYNQRGHQVYRILEVPVAGLPTGGEPQEPGVIVPRTVVDEVAKTFVDWTGKTWSHWLDRSGELLWMSERSGWCHLWLYDTRAGKAKNAVTQGEWVVRQVLHVDEERRQVWFYAGGVRPGQDPYYLHLCRVGFDGQGFAVLTEGDGTHKVEFSPDRRWFVDTWSRVDAPPVTELRRSDTGARVSVLAEADWAPLRAAGWTVPERFVAKGRDGTTDIHGIVITPSKFDPTKRYPVIEEIYAGPQGAFVPKEFGRLTRQHALAELGFVIVQIDGMGTSQRSKAFHDVCWKNLGDSGFPDRIAWMKAAATTRPWMDLTRVGIYGGSAGGQSSTRALLAHGDFYHVAASDCGCHDNRMDKIWWNEQWMGWPLGPHYEEQSNVTQAKQLKGHLLLTVGELDTNVDPASTLQVAAALVRADKDFDLLIIPGANHGAGETPYGNRRRMDHFVRHLWGQEPRRKE
jgi:dipeptidyl-peptidase-4